MPCKIQELRIENNLRFPLDDDTLEIIVTALMGDAAYSDDSAT